MKLTVGSLFAGIGGFDLGLERTGGFEVRWQVEIDEYCRRVLEKHWPHVKRYGDIREIIYSYERGREWERQQIEYSFSEGCRPGAIIERVDVLCGGFPCQDISHAGKRAGINGERSGLWREMARLIRMVRPRYVIVENVSGLLDRGMGEVVGELASMGYDAEWGCVSACAFGAPHTRERVFVLAYPTSERQGQLRRIRRAANSEETRNVHWSQAESAVGRVAHGIPSRVDRLKGLGNAVVPQVVEWIGNRILEFNK
jgi:DNA (cytosine-5)-methyltransferase 1